MTPISLALLTSWGACALLWRRGWFGLARAAAWFGTLALALIAAYYWQAYDKAWAMAVPLVIGVLVVSRCASKEEGDAAVWTGVVAVALPILFMLMTFSYFRKSFLIMRADASVREVVRFKGQWRDLPPPEREAALSGLVQALSGDDLFLKWGAIHQLRMGGPAAAPAAGAAARAVLSTRDIEPSLPRELMRVDGARFLGSLGADGGPALISILREGDEPLRRHALEAIAQVGPLLKDSALPELVKLSGAGGEGGSYPVASARRALEISEEEWRAAGGLGR